MDPTSIPEKNSKIVARKSGDEYILVPIKDNIADMQAVYTMNSTAAFIWDAIDGSRSVEELALIMVEEFEINIETARKDVAELLDDLAAYLIIA